MQMTGDPRRYPGKREGFSLIELLIVVAIIAALVGVAVPMFQQNIHEANVAKARQDLDTIRQAITLHDSQERPLIGTSLKPLLGRYLQEIPLDPWGNEYLMDANVGIIMSFGGDQQAGGVQEQDQDITVKFKPALKMQRVAYDGSWGIPRNDNEIRINWTKPFEDSSTQNPTWSPAGVLAEILLIQDTALNYGCTLDADGAIDADEAAVGAAYSGTPGYGTAWGTTWTYSATKSDGTNGLMVFVAGSTQAPDTSHFRITSTMALNLKIAAGATSSIVKEKETTGGPLDDLIYGSDAADAEGAIAVELIGTENRGVVIKRAR